MDEPVPEDFEGFVGSSDGTGFDKADRDLLQQRASFSHPIVDHPGPRGDNTSQDSSLNRFASFPLEVEKAVENVGTLEHADVALLPTFSHPILPILDRGSATPSPMSPFEAFEIECADRTKFSTKARGRTHRMFDRWIFPLTLIVCPGFVALIFVGTNLPLTCPPGSPCVGPKLELLAQRFAESFNISLETSPSGKLDFFHQDSHGSEWYRVKGGQFVLEVELESKLTRGRVRNFIGRNIPVTKTLQRVRNYGEIEIDGKETRYTALVKTILPSDKEGNIPVMASYIKARGYLPSDQAVAVARDISIALHALHTKVEGYVILHCNLVPSAVVAVNDETSYLERVILFDFRYARVKRLQLGQSSTEPIFKYNKTSSKRCSATNWDDYLNPNSVADVPFSANVDWRDLGHFIYRLVEVGYAGGADDVRDSRLFRGISSSCNYRCAAEKNLQSTQRLSGTLLEFTRFLLLEHNSIQNELTQVLGHPALDHLDVINTAASIKVEKPSEEFVRFFQN